MFSSLFSYLPMLELLSWSYCYLFVYSFIYLFLYSKTHSLLIHKLHVMRSDKYSHNIYNGIFLDLYLKWKWYCEKWVITTFILLRSHQAIQIFISKRIPQKKEKRKNSHRHVLRDSFYLPFTCLTRNAPSSKRNRFSVTIDIKFAHRKDAMGKEITALLFWQYCEINNIYRGRERGTKTKVSS